MNTLILAAGRGSRMRAHSDLLPKPLFPVFERRLIEHAIELALSIDPKKIVVNVYHLAEKMETFLRSSPKPWRDRIEISREIAPIGTGGAFVFAKDKLLGADRKRERWFAQINSDIVYDLDLAAMFEKARAQNSIAMLALEPIDSTVNGQNYTPIALDDRSRIVKIGSVCARGFDARARSRHFFAGVAIYSSKIYDYLPAKFPSDIGRDLLLPLLESGVGIDGFEGNGKWFDLGDTHSYHRAITGDLLRARSPAPARLWGDARGIEIEDPVYIDAAAHIDRGARIGPRSVICADVKIGRDARVSRSILFGDLSIAPGRTIEGAIVSPAGETRIGPN